MADTKISTREKTREHFNDRLLEQIHDVKERLDRVEKNIDRVNLRLDRQSARMDKLSDKIDALHRDIHARATSGTIANISTVGIALAVIYSLLK